MAIRTLSQSRFNGGIADSIRNDRAEGDIGSQFAISKHFDILTDERRLIPYRAMDNESLFDFEPSDPIYDGTTLYVLETDSSGGGGSQIGSKTTSAISTLNSSWSLASSSEDASNEKFPGGIARYDLSSGSQKLYFFSGAAGSPGLISNLVQYTISPAARANLLTGLAYGGSETAGGVIGKDDKLYMAYGRTLVSVDRSGTATDDVLTIPKEYVITDLEPYGNYLAIAGSSTTARATSKLYFWDYVSADVFDVVDFGEGTLQCIGNLEGTLVGVTNEYMGSNLNLNQGKMVIRSYSGGDKARVEKEIVAKGTGTGFIRQKKVIKNNRMYFLAGVPTETSNVNKGVWVFGRKDATQNYALTIAIHPEDMSDMDSFGFARNFVFVCDIDNGDVYQTHPTSGTFTYTSLVETQKLTCGDSSQIKNLKRAEVVFDPLPSGGQVVLKYRKDSETSWTSLKTVSTQNEMRLEWKIGSIRFKEIQFRIESTGGAEITGWRCKYETTES